jgi:urease accessory protein
MLNFKIKNWQKNIPAIAILTIIELLCNSQQAMAHHAQGGKTPDNFLNAFLSGLAHPVIGLDHFAFVVASGLMAIGQPQGIFIPLAFVIAAMAGTGIHLLEIDLPATEIVISASLVMVGILLATKNQEDNPSKFYTLVPIALAAGAGIFHGYAYGEAIIGAEMTPILAYLAGFTSIQLFIAWGAFVIGNILLKQCGKKQLLVMRFLGLIIGTIGVVFLTPVFR